MYKELLTFLVLYFVALAGHSGHARYVTWKADRARKRAQQNALNAISPLHVEPAKPHTSHHWDALIIAFVAHPATAASAKEYVVHFLVYSGYVLGSH